MTRQYRRYLEKYEAACTTMKPEDLKKWVWERVKNAITTGRKRKRKKEAIAKKKGQELKKTKATVTLTVVALRGKKLRRIDNEVLAFQYGKLFQNRYKFEKELEWNEDSVCMTMEIELEKLAKSKLETDKSLAEVPSETAPTDHL